MSEERRRPTFYRNLFAGLCFIFLLAGLRFGSARAFWGCMVCGAFSRTAMKKRWPDPLYAETLRRRLRPLLSFLFRRGAD